MKKSTPTRIKWEYVTGRTKCYQIIIQQRLDGPFAKNIVGGPGYYYISVEKWMNTEYTEWDWVHQNGTRTANSFEEAERIMKSFKKVYRNRI